MTRALKAVAAIALAIVAALLLASVAVAVLALIAWPLLAALTFGAAREGLGEALGLNPKEETPPWT